MLRIQEVSLSIQHSHFREKSCPHLVTGRNVTVSVDAVLILWLQRQMQPDARALKGL